LYLKIVKRSKKITEPATETLDVFKLTNKNIYITGTRDAQLIDLIKKHKGTIQSTFNGSTHFLVKKDDDYSNKKTEDAVSKHIPVFTIKTFTEFLNL
jgi:hypothetical protein